MIGDERVVNEVGQRCHMVRFVNVLYDFPTLLFLLRDLQLFVIL